MQKLVAPLFMSKSIIDFFFFFVESLSEFPSAHRDDFGRKGSFLTAKITQIRIAIIKIQ